uniref:Uncharacterized protein n=1 Tax=Ciona intestinalis TaxID=7719 RepID=F6Y1A4_CIOIN
MPVIPEQHSVALQRLSMMFALSQQRLLERKRGLPSDVTGTKICTFKAKWSISTENLSWRNTAYERGSLSIKQVSAQEAKQAAENSVSKAIANSLSKKTVKLGIRKRNAIGTKVFEQNNTRTNKIYALRQ